MYIVLIPLLPLHGEILAFHPTKTLHLPLDIWVLDRATTDSLIKQLGIEHPETRDLGAVLMYFHSTWGRELGHAGSNLAQSCSNKVQLVAKMLAMLVPVALDSEAKSCWLWQLQLVQQLRGDVGIFLQHIVNCPWMYRKGKLQQKQSWSIFVLHVRVNNKDGILINMWYDIHHFAILSLSMSILALYNVFPFGWELCSQGGTL